MSGAGKGWRGMALCALVLCLAGGGSLHSQYILDEEEKRAVEEMKPEPEPVVPAQKIPAGIAFNIKAVRIPDITDLQCAIKINWDLNPGYTGEYVVVRSDRIIDTKEKALAARVIQTVNATANNAIIDTDCTPGDYYYAVLSRKSVLDGNVELYRDVNFTTFPVRVLSADALYRVSGIRAEIVNEVSVRLTWNRIDKTGLFYTIYRSRRIIDTDTRLQEADRIRVVADAGEFIDDTISVSGTYYYAVTAKVLYGMEDVRLITDENYTSIGLEIGIRSPLKLASIDARAEKDGVRIRWNYTGSQGNRLYTLFRSPKPRVALEGVDAWTILRKVDITDKGHTDIKPPPGSWYYGLIPEGADPVAHRLVPGVSITRTPARPGKKREIVEAGDIDRILKRTFFRGRYGESLKELQKLLGATDNERVAAKARLFMGRSYIEQGRYGKAVEYLVLPDVKRYFPKEAAFWMEFALARIRK